MSHEHHEVADPTRHVARRPNRRMRILLADDHTLLGSAFEKLLESEYDVIGNVSDGRALLAAAAKHKPDVILLDILMPVLNGLDAARQLRKTLPDCKLIFLTMSEDPQKAAEAFRIGASGYLLKTSAAAELFQAIDQVLAGRSYITPLIADGMVKFIMTQPASTDGEIDITPRQREVLQLFAEGHSMKEIARIINVSPRTVAYHKYRAMDQLNLTTSAELVRFAIKKGIVSP